MKTRILFLSIIIMLVSALPALASGKGEIQKYFNDASKKVKATENAADKRVILDESFNNMFNALGTVQSTGLLSKEESDGVDLFKESMKEKQDELNGLNGYERIPDSQLNDFSNYVVQDMEQASITISLVTLLLLAILLILIL